MQKCSCVMQQHARQQQRTLPADTAADTAGADSLKLGTRSRGCGLNWLLNRKPEISSPARREEESCAVALRKLPMNIVAGQAKPRKAAA